MQVKDVMTRNVISISPDDSVRRAATLMLENRISGLPVVGIDGELVGIITEGDFLRRCELGTQRRRSRWLQFIVGPGELAEEYVQAAGRKVEEVMTPNPWTVSENDPLDKVVELMERRRVKRLPVLRDGWVVGIVSRANLMHALVSAIREAGAATHVDDPKVRDNILGVLRQFPWNPRISVVVKNGSAELWGTITDERERKAIAVAVENVPGVEQIHDHLVWVEPMSGVSLLSAEDEQRERDAC